MNKWEMVRLGDVCVKKIDTLSSSLEEKIFYIDISSVDNEKKEIITYQTLESKEAPSRAKQILQLYDIIISTVRPNLNAVAINNIRTTNLVVASTGYCVLRPKDTANTKYLFNFCCSKTFISSLMKVAKGASYPAVSNSDIKKLQIPLPPLEEQKRIAKNLDLASELVKLHKTTLAELDKLIQSVFYDMFGDPVTNEKGWEVSRLGDKCKIYRGASPRPIEKYLGGIVPWIKIGDGTNGDNIYISHTKECVTEDGAKKSRLIKKGGLIFANCGVSLGFARILKIDGCIHDGWLAFEEYENSLNKLFFLKALNFCTVYFRKIAPDGTQPNLNTGIMKSYMQIFPPLPLQQKFADIVTQIENQKTQVQTALNDAEQLYNSLMQEYFE